jgi:hypothetical protein
MSSSDTKALIEQAVANIASEVPALAPLKIVIDLELRGRGDVQVYRVELPGPKISKQFADDAKVRLEIPRADFNELVAAGGLDKWIDAFEHGHAKASGQDQIIKLIANVVARQSGRNHTSKLH